MTVYVLNRGTVLANDTKSDKDIFVFCEWCCQERFAVIETASQMVCEECLQRQIDELRKAVSRFEHATPPSVLKQRLARCEREIKQIERELCQHPEVILSFLPPIGHIDGFSALVEQILFIEPYSDTEDWGALCHATGHVFSFKDAPNDGWYFRHLQAKHVDLRSLSLNREDCAELKTEKWFWKVESVEWFERALKEPRERAVAMLLWAQGGF